MKRYQQKKILEFIQTLHEANAEINRFLLTREFSSVIQILADCQDFVVQIGKFIEDIEGEGTRTVTLLEEYHKLLYEASLEVNEETGKGGFVRRLHKQLIQIENSLRIDLKPDKIEVAFLPYKADMWDSLESVYLAAKADPQCNAYCVPIPYFTRNSDGSFGKMHYEGDLYPDYVDVTNWRNYDIVSRRPDVIFIHNPYDGNNHVTAIHPNYYSEKLCKLTELLVYIPYFVTTKTQEHFCFTNGTIYAHKTIVQNDAERKRYIDFYKKNEESYNCVGKFGKSKNKFVALGSPKFDKVLNIKREDCILPDEWRALIESAGGKRKKVVFYNTTLAEILQHSEHFLKKLRSVLDIFRHREDVVLWWRPHPLSLATFESMRLQLADDYRTIVAEYRCSAWGIYDDTADLHRGIAWSDAYYGFGGSSVALLYGATLKPVMVSHTCDNASIVNNECDFNEKLLHFMKCLKMFLSGNPLYVDMPLFGFFFDDKNNYDLCHFLHYITHIEDYDKTSEWNFLMKTAYEKLGISAEKRSGNEIIKYIKQELKL